MPPLHIKVKLAINAKKRSISLRDAENKEFHMMLIWDKNKPENFKEIYMQLGQELQALINKNNNLINFKTLFIGNNSTYGQLDDWLTEFIRQQRAKYRWINTEKDLPIILIQQIDDKKLFAHFSRREIKENTDFLNALSSTGNDIVLQVASIEN